MALYPRGNMAGPSIAASGAAAFDALVDKLLVQANLSGRIARVDLTSQGKARAREEGSDAERFSHSGKKTHVEDGDHSWRTTRDQRGKEPRVDEITRVDTPAGFSPLKFTLYDGIADPQDHIIHFKQPKRGAVMCKYRKDPDDLFRVQQQKGESLRDYIQRFNDMKVEIMDCPDVVVCNAFKCMVQKKPRNLLHTLQKAQTFIVLEEETALDVQRAVKEG
ncbi:hypothetical protein FNV43_RR00510 [Rhamnella rubrinervis]|uniref:Retrotransposon gag domain-containing protein n=1 Tax=Rhamnella rubrinervis TaxID=2594499 RepID=A0A8K0HPQ4_9ROSA|nr:hypothetical protein FNV43_RR00510 [Rhamnella rubrinervis]